VGDGEEQFLKENLTHFIQASGVPLPGLGDFGYYFLLSVQRQEHFVHSFHEAEILLEVDSVFALVESWLLAHELPKEAGLFFKGLVIEDLLVVSLHYDVLDHEFITTAFTSKFFFS